jgi:hypothetical protein
MNQSLRQIFETGNLKKLDSFFNNDGHLFDKFCKSNDGKLIKRFKKYKSIKNEYKFIFPNNDLGCVVKKISLTNIDKILKVEFYIENKLVDTYYKDIYLSLKYLNNVTNILPTFINKIGFPLLEINPFIKIFVNEECDVEIKYELYTSINYSNDNIYFMSSVADKILDKNLVYYYILVGNFEPPNKLKINVGCKINFNSTINYVLELPRIKSIGNNHIYGFASDYYDNTNCLDLTGNKDSHLILPKDDICVYTVYAKSLKLSRRIQNEIVIND